MWRDVLGPELLTRPVANLLPTSFLELSSWAVQSNADAEYHESGDVISEEELQALDDTQPAVPERRQSG
jgi:hypothetical protein